ncbi:MAG TPA: hypothetical protein VH208_05185 [Myxococcaceae bacterium]|nr:hypothetical protein [Myxococcaceae bacterium]
MGTATHAEPLQHPVQLAGPQLPPSALLTQCPPWQKSAPQLVHAPPPEPQAPWLIPVSHRPRPSQQPLQELGPHEPPSEVAQRPPRHTWLKEQIWQLAPPAPHAWSVVPGMHAPLESTHPPHEASGMQAPTELQAWFPLQVAQAPPPTPHWARLEPSSQTPLESQHPLQSLGLHWLPPSFPAGRHAPEAQTSPGTQTVQALPPEPHAACWRP